MRKLSYPHNLPNGKEKRQVLARYRFGLEAEEFTELLSPGICEICERELSEYGEDCSDKPSPHIDHCAETLNIRGVLCKQCNSGIGLLRHDPKIMQAAIDYLKKKPRFKKKSLRKLATHCKHGHPFSAENTYLLPDGRRRCKICALQRSKAWRKKNPEYFREYERNRYAKQKEERGANSGN